LFSFFLLFLNCIIVLPSTPFSPDTSLFHPILLSPRPPAASVAMLRRRTKDAPNDSSSRPSVWRAKTNEDLLREEFGGARVKQLVIKPQSKPRSKRRNGLIFALGGLFGIFIALFFANQQEVISLDSLMDLNIESLIDVIPQGIVRDAKEFSVCLMGS
jgi:hypothetical protein